MDNLQTAMGEAQWARLEREKRPYRVLSPAAPGAVAYWLAMAMFADHAGGRTDLVQASLDAAREAVPSTNDDAREYTNDDLLREQRINEFEM